MAASVEDALVEALCLLLDFVAERPPDATEDDDVRALESAASVLAAVPDTERDRLVTLIGRGRQRWWV